MTRWPFLSPGWSHAICTTIAVILALYVAYYLQLESPYSAATTVLVVASPVHGMVLAKSVYRFLGTVLGAAASVLLMACFAQTPELFLLGTAIWVGFFTAMSSLLRRFRAYGAVLAGYTITLVAFGAVDKPLTIFDLSMARVAVVTIGVACSALVTILLAPNTATRDFPLKLKAALAAVATFLERSLLSGADDPAAAPDEAAVTAARLQAARQIQALDTALYAAAAESPGAANRSGYIRRVVAALFGLLASASSLRSSGDLAADAEIRAMSDRAAALARRLAAEGASRELSAAIRTLRTESAAIQAGLDAKTQALAMIAHNRLDDLLDHLLAVSDSLVAFADPKAKRLDIRLPHYRDVPAALINGLRGMIAVGLLSVFWIYTAWPNGAQLFGAMVPICALLGASDRQQKDSIDFFTGVFIAAVAGLICGYGFLTQVSGFPLLALAMAPFVMAGAYFSTKPKTAGIATGFLIFFVTFVGPRNPMQFDLASYLNTVFANLVGMATLLPVFRVVFPQHHGRSARNLARQLVESLGGLARRPTLARLLRWEHQAHDRLTAIAVRLPLDDPQRARLLAGGFAAIRIARDLVRVQTHLLELPLDHVTREKVLQAIHAVRQVVRRPDESSRQLIAAADRLEISAETLPAETAAVLRRDIAALREGAQLLAQHQDFFGVRSWRIGVTTKHKVQEVAPC